MNIIAAVDKNWGIGKDNNLLDHIPEDMKFFRETTVGKAVIMGKNTLLSFPNQKPLSNRENIVLTHSDLDIEDIEIFDDLKAAIAFARELFEDDEIFVIGGESVYRQALPLCKKAYITKIDKAYDADRFMPNLDEDKAWKITEEKAVETAKGINITFTLYEKV